MTSAAVSRPLLPPLHLPLVAFTGLAVDTARGYLVKTRLNYALDSAALAGGRVMFDATARDAAIQDFLRCELSVRLYGGDPDRAHDDD